MTAVRAVVPMSTIDGYWLSFGTPTVARGRCVRFVVFLQPSGGALIGCARNRKSFMHMGTGFTYSETSTNYCRARGKVFGEQTELSEHRSYVHCVKQHPGHIEPS